MGIIIGCANSLVLADCKRADLTPAIKTVIGQREAELHALYGKALRNIMGHQQHLLKDECNPNEVRLKPTS